MRFIPLNKEQKTIANVLLLLFQHFCNYFLLQNFVVFVDGVHKNISCPRA